MFTLTEGVRRETSPLLQEERKDAQDIQDTTGHPGILRTQQEKQEARTVNPATHTQTQQGVFRGRSDIPSTLGEALLVTPARNFCFNTPNWKLKLCSALHLSSTFSPPRVLSSSEVRKQTLRKPKTCAPPAAVSTPAAHTGIPRPCSALLQACVTGSAHHSAAHWQEQCGRKVAAPLPQCRVADCAPDWLRGTPAGVSVWRGVTWAAARTWQRASRVAAAGDVLAGRRRLPPLPHSTRPSPLRSSSARTPCAAAAPGGSGAALTSSFRKNVSFLYRKFHGVSLVTPPPPPPPPPPPAHGCQPLCASPSRSHGSSLPHSLPRSSPRSSPRSTPHSSSRSSPLPVTDLRPALVIDSQPPGPPLARRPLPPLPKEKPKRRGCGGLQVVLMVGAYALLLVLVVVVGVVLTQELRRPPGRPVPGPRPVANSGQPLPVRVVRPRPRPQDLDYVDIEPTPLSGGPPPPPVQRAPPPPRPAPPPVRRPSFSAVDTDFSLTQGEEDFRGRKEPEIRILKSWNNQNPDGTLSWGYIGSDGSFKNETRRPRLRGARRVRLRGEGDRQAAVLPLRVRQPLRPQRAGLLRRLLRYRRRRLRGQPWPRLSCPLPLPPPRPLPLVPLRACDVL
ncbi:WAS/WASL-interacting protein family member 3-like [Scylla paramamosain]|uniref:WAS/WASL-interacting protein family member 3-like n=1 Tax=Scylla paramamosain TaxID=85552 RepID=UPI003083B319